MTPAAASASGREGEPTQQDRAFVDDVLDDLYDRLNSSVEDKEPVEVIAEHIRNINRAVAQHRAAACREAVREATEPLVKALEQIAEETDRMEIEGDGESALDGSRIEYIPTNGSKIAKLALRAHAAMKAKP